jgi:hypothetical protein
MTDLSYTPSFVHTDWLGGIDRVEAGGPSGLNARLHAIESDLRQASTVVSRINTELGQLGPATSAAQQVAFTPTLGPMAAPVLPWGFDAVGVPNGTVALGNTLQGLVSLDLPDGARMASLRVRLITDNEGIDDDTEFTAIFARAAVRLATPPAIQTLVLIDNRGFTQDVTMPVPADVAVVDRTNFRYFLIMLFTAQAEEGFDAMRIQSIAINLQPN